MPDKCSGRVVGGGTVRPRSAAPDRVEGGGRVVRPRLAAPDDAYCFA